MMTTRNSLIHASLDWRGPWWFWQGLTLAVSTLLAPTFLMIGVLLTRDARSDHPVFWPSLMVIVLLANTFATVGANQLQHRVAAAGRVVLALRYCAFAMPAGGLLFLAFGFGTGFLPDFFATASGHGAMDGAAVLWSVVLAATYSVLSFTHAGLLYAWLGFAPAGQVEAPGQSAWEPLH